MAKPLKEKLIDKSLSSRLFFTVLGLELAIFFIALLLDLLCHVPLYTFGRLLHYFVLVYFTFLAWSGLTEGKLSKFWQVLLFSIIPLTEFFLINMLGYSNLWGYLFLVLYIGILCSFLGIDLTNPSNGNGSGFSGKIIKSAIKGLKK